MPRTEKEDRRVLLDALKELGEHAEREGTLVLLEPLNRYEDHMLNRVEQAVELCEAVGRPSVKVMGDLFHMNIEEDDLGEAIRRAGGHIAHVHLADSNRLQPGAGHTDFAGAFAALRGSASTATWPWSAASGATPETVFPKDQTLTVLDGVGVTG